jgi:hypothetical protein
VGDYFEHLKDDWTGGARPREVTPPPKTAALDGEALRLALSRLPLPVKGRKLTTETLWAFLCQTGGRWFKLLDFEAHFRVNKKTAWSYLNLLLQEGIVEHNGEKANRVRYALAPALRSPA